MVALIAAFGVAFVLVIALAAWVVNKRRAPTTAAPPAIRISVALEGVPADAIEKRPD